MRIKLDKLDILFSKIVRQKADNHCEYCGKYTPIKKLQCSHYHGRRKRSVRWDFDNACAVCFGCHLFLGENPYAHTEFFKKRLGSDRFEQLNIRANTIGSPDKAKLEIEFKEMLCLLNGKNKCHSKRHGIKEV